MVTHQIVCVETLHPHRHITHVGIGNDHDSADQRVTVERVRDALLLGARFYTVSPSTGRTANVEAVDYRYPSGIVKTIRSAADAIQDNNLDNLRTCRRWKS